MVFVPVAIGHKLESKNPGEPRRGLNVGIAVGLTVALLAVAGSLFARDETWFEEYWPREAVEAVRAELGPDDRVFASDRFSDWMLFKIPELRGRVAYDVRFELYERDFYRRAAGLRVRGRAELEVLRGRLPDRHRRREAQVAHGGLPRRARRARRSTETTRSDRDRPRAGDLAGRAAAEHHARRLVEDLLPGRIAFEPRQECLDDLRVARQDRRVRRHDPGIDEVDDDPLRTTKLRDRIDVPARREVRGGGVRRANGRIVGDERDRVARARSRAPPERSRDRRAASRPTDTNPRADARASTRRADEDRRRRRAIGAALRCVRLRTPSPRSGTG